jgi:hypothetical protein
VRIKSPTAVTYTNRTVSITADIDQDVDLRVALRANQLYLGTVTGPDYRLDWDTTTAAEAMYEVVAEIEIDGTLVQSSPVRIVVDRTAPTVVSRTMVKHDGGVKLSAPVEVLLSEPVTAASITDDAISFTANGIHVPVTAALGADGKTVSIRIKDRSALTLPATFEGSLAPGIKDLAGNALVATGAAWTWSAPAVFDYHFSANNASGVPDLAVGPNLEPCAFYLGRQSSQSADYGMYVLMAGAQGWVSLPPPTTRRFGVGLSADIAVDDRGYPIIAWTEDGHAEVAFWNGEGWDRPLPGLDADDEPATPVGQLLLARGPDGQLFIGWREDTGSGDDVHVARARGSAWDRSLGAIGLPMLGITTAMTNLVVTDGSGMVTLTWGGRDGPGGVSVWHGQGWTTSTPPGPIVRITAGPDETGAPLALQGRPALNVVRLMDDEWKPAFSPLPTESPLYSALGVGPDRRPVVAWIDTAGVLSLARWLGTSWDMRAAATITAPPGSVGELMTVDAQGNMWIAWNRYPNVEITMSNY